MKGHTSQLLIVLAAFVIGLALGIFYNYSNSAGAYSLKKSKPSPTHNQWQDYYDFSARCSAKGINYWAEGDPKDANSWKGVDHKNQQKHLFGPKPPS